MLWKIRGGSALYSSYVTELPQVNSRMYALHLSDAADTCKIAFVFGTHRPITFSWYWQFPISNPKRLRCSFPPFSSCGLNTIGAVRVSVELVQHIFMYRILLIIARSHVIMSWNVHTFVHLIPHKVSIAYSVPFKAGHCMLQHHTRQSDHCTRIVRQRNPEAR